MPRTVRCKMVCGPVTSYAGGVTDVKLSPVCSDVEGSENKKFWEYTPCGELALSSLKNNPGLIPGKEYYVDIIEADEEAPVTEE